mmetsp:Transcript_599/g.1735  ORF Transcript_599/g.1735 Transcript_599/m.1735 type:complete len:265 (-) Transcript_599:354-1148(-)
MHKLPPRLLPIAPILQRPLHVIVIPGVLGVVAAQGAEEDHGHQASQEQHHHEAVEDAEPVDLVLEEVVVKVALEAAGEGGGGGRPLHAVRELQSLPHRQRVRLLAGQVHLDDPIVIVCNLEGLVGVDVDVLVIFGLLWRRPHEAPHRQVINEQLIPVMLLHRLLENLHISLLQRQRADVLLGDIRAVLDVQLRVNELVALQDFPQPSPFVRRLARPRRFAEWQVVVIVRLLRVVVRSNFVDPQPHVLPDLIGMVVCATDARCKH